MKKLLVCSFLLIAAPARADHGVIALLPLAADARLALYGQPVASEVAKSLEHAGYSIVLVTSTAPVPSQARLVIDGRIVRGDNGEVKLEARVRDPAIGKVVGEVSASAPELTRIDEAADALAAQLATAIAAHDAPPVVTPPPPPAPDAPKPPPPPPMAKVEAKAPPATAGDPDLSPLVEAGGHRLAKILGKRAAATTIAIELLGIRYDDKGVITARARAHVKVSDGDRIVFDRVVRTDTLVGGRGDRRDAVAREAIDQIVDIAAPRIKERL